MKYMLFFISLFVSVFSFSQNKVTTQHFGDTSSFVLQGKIINLKNQYFEYSISGFFNGERSSIIVDSSGNFFKSIKLENTQQDLFLLLNNNPIGFSVKKNDTINISCDANRLYESFRITTQNKERANALHIQYLECKDFLLKSVGLQMKIYQDKSLNDSAKFNLINTLFNKDLRLIVDSSKYYNFYWLYYNAYFFYSKILFQDNLIPKFNLIGDTTYAKDYGQKLAIKNIKYNALLEDLFWTCSNYRDFIYDYGRIFHMFNSFSGEGEDYFNPTLDYYYLAKAQMNIVPIRKWFITKSIIDGYGNYKFDDVTSVNNMYQKELKDDYLKQLLKGKYNAIVTLKKGVPAPAFTLKNEEGQNISLTDFKGKIVYLDFWGVGCGPCIYEIDNYAKKLHEKYKGKDVVFVSVCVDSDESEWKVGMKKHTMNGGVNLIAKGWSNNPVCKAYNVTGIPHYVLINRDGKMYDNNAPRMYELLQKSTHNEIDELLSK